LCAKLVCINHGAVLAQKLSGCHYNL
jgi:hypothetical protein